MSRHRLKLGGGQIITRFNILAVFRVLSIYVDDVLEIAGISLGISLGQCGRRPGDDDACAARVNVCCASL